jgi:HAD superfamily hydrolase (TIGR01509 family)
MGLGITAEAIEKAEPLVRREIASYVWAATAAENTGATRRAGPAFFRRLLDLAGVQGASDALDSAAEEVWTEHLKRNVFCRVGDGVDAALGHLRAAGIKLAVVSNSEGTVERMLQEVGLRRHLDAVFDSWIVGVAKPDPRIFIMALDRLDVPADQAIMVGDTPGTDIAGARAAGVKAALIDPLDLHPGATAPRFSDLPAFAQSLLDDPRRSPLNRR